MFVRIILLKTHYSLLSDIYQVISHFTLSCLLLLLQSSERRLKGNHFHQRGAVFVRKMIQEIIDLKSQNSNVHEIKIVGLLSVHVDCDLELEDWHGVNVAIVTDKLYVDKEVRWDVSGRNIKNRGEQVLQISTHKHTSDDIILLFRFA
jgi:hypothetical protein